MSPRRPALPLLALALAFWSGGASAAPTIVGGSPASGHPAVAAILDANGEMFCTGFLVAPSCLLTAAHCAVELDPFHSAFFGPAIDQPYDAWVNLAGSATIHPSYTPESFEHDLALLPLIATPGPSPIDFGAAPAESSTVTLVGFGYEEFFAGDGVKREAEVEVIDTSPTLVQLDGSVASACFGDSGGPVLAAEGDQLVAVAVMVGGIGNCDGGTLGAVVDADAAWLAANIEEGCQTSASGNALFFGRFEGGTLGGWWSTLSICENRCGDFDEIAPCQCDELCEENGDCCADLCDVCGVCA